MRLIDTHVHLNDRRFAGEVAQAVERAREAGVVRMINVGSDAASSQLAAEQAARFAGVFAAAGIHPHNAAEAALRDLERIRRLLQLEQTVALGEIGLDYHYDFSPRTVQQEWLERQLVLAAEENMPVIIHDRESHQDVYERLAAQQGRVQGVMHCYSGSVEMAARFLDLGFYISLAGPVTFKNARKLPDVARYVPADRLLVETDCPYLAPVPYRGKRNEPAYVLEVARRVAQLRGIPLEELAEQVWINSERLFRIGGANA